MYILGQYERQFVVWKNPKKANQMKHYMLPDICKNFDWKFPEITPNKWSQMHVSEFFSK